MNHQTQSIIRILQGLFIKISPIIMTIINSDPCQFVDEFMVSIYNITHNMMWASIFIFIENPIIQIEVQDSYLL